MSTLNPNDSRRRGRSKSPGRRREDEEPRRERSRVRAPSPPTVSSKYAYEEETRGKGYAYDDDRERSARDREVINAEPRGYGYDERDSDPRDPYAGYKSGGRPEYGGTTYGSSGRDERKEDEYAMPGAFTSAEEEKPRYVTASSSGRDGRGREDHLAYEGKVKKEKDYYKDLAYGDEPYEKKDKYGKDKYATEDSRYEKLYGKSEKDKYGRGTSPLPPSRKERGRYEDESPPRKSKTKYEEDTIVRDKYGRATSPLPPSRKERARYEDESPPRLDKYGRATSPLPSSRKSKYDDDEPPRHSKYDVEDSSRPSRYEEDKYKYGPGPDVREEKRYHEDTYKSSKHSSDDRHGRERGASYGGAAGYSAPQHVPGAAGYDPTPAPPRSSYVRPPSPSDFAPPGALGRQPVQTTSAVPTGGVPAYAQPQQQQYGYGQASQQQPYAITGEAPPISYTSQPPSAYGSNPAYAPNQYQAAPPVDPRYQQAPQPAYGADPRYAQAQVITAEPGARHALGAPAPSGGYGRDPSPGPGLNRGMHSLSVSTGHHGSASLSLANAPGSPLLESYHGTYQSISPMPSPLMIAQTAYNDVNVIQALEPDSSSDEDSASGRTGKKKRRNARFHDPAEEARILAQALKADRRSPDTEPLIEILPGLTHDQIIDLRVEYKKIVKTGSERKGVNIAKHIKSRLKEEDPSLMKACYTCALGKWESEAYWANFWYQGEHSRRELLIESLMGRTNREIREIKDGFADKKYSDSLVKCMKSELKEDKFKRAILLALDEKKMEDRPGYPVDRTLVEDDVKDLYRAVKSAKGGETAMIDIIVVRSDSHLREVLRIYEASYRANFAREMLKKSGNLVGELLAHILNGIINKPVRDALLINHALSLSKSDSIRTELLISRLVRYHWDRPHMEAVKKEYRNRYGIDMRKAVAQGTKGEWGQFCEMLCVTRMHDEVRRLDEFRR